MIREPRYSRVASGEWPERLVEARELLIRLFDGVEPDGTTCKGGLWLFMKNLRPVKSEHLPFGTLAVDAYWRLFWTPRYVAETPLPRLAAALMHECNHVLRQHPDRFSDLLKRTEAFNKYPLGPDDTHRLWNFATDAEINGRLRAQGVLDVGPDWFYPEAFGAGPGTAAETMFWTGVTAGSERAEQDLEEHKQIVCGFPQPGGQKGQKRDDTASQDGKGGDTGVAQPPQGTGQEGSGRGGSSGQQPGDQAGPSAGSGSSPGKSDPQPQEDDPGAGDHGPEESKSDPAEKAGDADGSQAAAGGDDPGNGADPDDAGQPESDQVGGNGSDGPDGDRSGGPEGGDALGGISDDGVDGGGEAVGESPDGTCTGWAVYMQDLPEEVEREAQEQDVPRLPREVQDDILDDVAREITRPDSGASGGGRGTGSSDQFMWAEARLAGRFRWETVITRYVGRAMESRGQSDFTFKRPSRRAASTPGIILPKTISRKPEMVLILDTSGSMRSQAIQDWLLSEARNIARVLGVPMVAGFCDARMLGQIKIDGSTVRINAPGGGGTDMRVGIAWAEENYPNAVAVVVFTDGITPWPETRGAKPLIIGLFGAFQSCIHYKRYCPAWAKTVIIAKPENL